MPSSRQKSLAEERRDLTGEKPQRVHTALLQPGAENAPLPAAANDGQASLEAMILGLLGRARHAQVWTPTVPFMVSSVTPEPDALTMSFPDEYLPDVIRELFPHWDLDDTSTKVNMHGIGGLRYHCERKRVILTRLGYSGQVRIPDVNADRWDRACRVAVDSLGDGRYAHPWRESSEKWNSDEKTAWSRRRETEAGRRKFASQILRRLPGLRLPGAYWHDLWINWWDPRCFINLEWMNGSSHDELLKRFLNSGLGLDVEICMDRSTAWTAENCHTLTQGRVALCSRSEPTEAIILRRLRDPDLPSARDLGWSRIRAEQAAIEEKHGYRVRRPRSLQGR